MIENKNQTDSNSKDLSTKSDIENVAAVDEKQRSKSTRSSSFASVIDKNKISITDKNKANQLKCVISPKLILDADCLIGSYVQNVNPKCKSFIYTKKRRFHVINLEKTIEYINLLYRFVRFQAQEGKTFLFVGTKRNASYYIKSEAERCGASYINKRWISGLFTNFSVVKNNIRKYNNLVKLEARGAFKSIPKKELSVKMREIEKLKASVGGILGMYELPNFIFVVDTINNSIAVKEARMQKIPVMAIINTNADPSAADFFIPANNDNYRSIRLISTLIADAICEAKGEPVKITNKPDLEVFPVAEDDEYDAEMQEKREKYLARIMRRENKENKV